MQNHIASQQTFLSAQIDRIPENERKSGVQRNNRGATVANTQARYGPGGPTNGGSAYQSNGSSSGCGNCGSQLHRSAQCPYVYTDEETAKINKDYAIMMNRSTENPEEVLRKRSLNWAKFADSITGSANPTQELETKMKLMATTFNLRVTPNPDRTRPYEQLRNEDFAKLKAFIMGRMGGQGAKKK